MRSLTCKNVLYLLPLYTDGKTTEEQSTEIENHLRDCPSCFEKYLSLKSVAERIKSAFENFEVSEFKAEKQSFKNNLCAYIDNELSKNDYYEFNNYVTQNPDAKKELEEMYMFDEKLKACIEANKKTLDNDLSDKVVNVIKKESPTYIYELYIKAAVLTGIFVILTAVAGYYSIPDNMQKITDLKTKVFSALND